MKRRTEHILRISVSNSFLFDRDCINVCRGENNNRQKTHFLTKFCSYILVTTVYEVVSSQMSVFQTLDNPRKFQLLTDSKSHIIFMKLGKQNLPGNFELNILFYFIILYCDEVTAITFSFYSCDMIFHECAILCLLHQNRPRLFCYKKVML